MEKLLPLGKMEVYLRDLKEWSLDSNALVKEYNFPNFKESMEFVNKVAEIAERTNHHPTILIEYDKVRLVVTSHDAHGVTEKDIHLIKLIDIIHD